MKLLNIDAEYQQHFAFIFERNKIISIGQNDTVRTSVRAVKLAKKFGAKKALKYPYIHAETNAISKLWGKYHISSKNKLISLRLNKHGELRTSLPCKDCSIILNGLNLSFIYFNGSKFIG